MELETICHPDGVVATGAEVEAHLVRLDEPVRLDVRSWALRDAACFDADEEARFDGGRGVFAVDELPAPPAAVAAVKQSFYDRSSGDFRVRWSIRYASGERFLVSHAGADTSAFEPMKRLMPRFADLAIPEALLSVSLGNQGDLPGNFHVVGDPGRPGWRLFAASDEPWSTASRPGLVELRDGTRFAGLVELDGDPATALVRSVRVQRPGLRAPIVLDPAATRLVLVTYTLVWEGQGGAAALRRHYGPRCDLRHLFRFPFVENRPLFNRALCEAPELLARAFAEQALELPWPDPALGRAAPAAALARMEASQGYRRVATPAQVRRAGDFAEAAGWLRVKLLRARYPLSALVLGEAAAQLALVTVRGQSGRSGACYWTIGDWLTEVLGWRPAAVFALDNGSDTSWDLAAGLDGQVVAGPVRLVSGRERVNAALQVLRRGG